MLPISTVISLYCSFMGCSPEKPFSIKRLQRPYKITSPRFMIERNCPAPKMKRRAVLSAKLRRITHNPPLYQRSKRRQGTVEWVPFSGAHASFVVTMTIGRAQSKAPEPFSIVSPPIFNGICLARCFGKFFTSKSLSCLWLRLVYRRHGLSLWRRGCRGGGHTSFRR